MRSSPPTRAALLTGAFLVLVLAAACGGDSKSTEPPNGAELFKQQACTTCHANGEGTGLGPALHGKKGFWTRAELVLYLKQPQEYAAKDKRLAPQGKKYLQAMPSYRLLQQAELEALADHVLAMP